MGVGIGHFDVIAKDAVKAHLKRFDPGALPFRRFQILDPLPAAAAGLSTGVGLTLHLVQVPKLLIDGGLGSSHVRLNGSAGLEVRLRGIWSKL